MWVHLWLPIRARQSADGKRWEKALSCGELTAIRVNFYLDPTTPYKSVTLVTKDEQEYSLNVDPHSGEVEYLFEHFGHHQLKGELSERVEEIHLDLFPSINGYILRLQDGNLVERDRETETIYPWESLEDYRVDKPADTIQLKFKEKKSFVNLHMHQVTNLHLLLLILEKFGRRG